MTKRGSPVRRALEHCTVRSFARHALLLLGETRMESTAGSIIPLEPEAAVVCLLMHAIAQL
jgi:hypothetical protein